MAYDASGRSQRGVPDTAYFVSTVGDSLPADYTEPRENSYPSDYRDLPISRPPKMSALENTGSIGSDVVSPELIAAITERVKNEVVEHLRQNGNLEDLSQPLQRETSNRSSSTMSSSSPPDTSSRRAHTPPSPVQIPIRTGYVPPPPPIARSPPANPLDKPSNVRFTDRSRPMGGPRTFSTVELSTIDQKWGRLFDTDGNPTQRLGMFLRGLANRVIEDFTPKKSIVITPNKMATYYQDFAMPDENQPLFSIFKAQSNEQISKFYQDLGCQHHLVQVDEASTLAPTVPALTPYGFARWMTIFLLAYPDLESKRLEKVVLALPIDADGQQIDGKPERLPKQISRHLLPDKDDRSSRKLVDDAITNFFNDLGSTNRRGKAAITPPPLSRHTSTSQQRTRPQPVEIHQVKTSPPTSRAPLERERKPYAGAPSTASENSSNEDAVTIERDRQPYTAQPGNSKVYTDASSMNTGPRSNRANSTTRPPRPRSPIENEPRHHRTQSSASQTYVPPPRTSGKRRTSSPPPKKYSNSTPINIYNSGQPLSATSSTYPSQFPPPPPADKRPREEWHHRRGTEEEARLAGEFNSPRDAERYDRFQDSRAAETDRSYDNRGSISAEPRDTRGAAYEDWYREPTSARGAYDVDKRY